jgi:hypothetical protein
MASGVSGRLQPVEMSALVGVRRKSHESHSRKFQGLGTRNAPASENPLGWLADVRGSVVGHGEISLLLGFSGGFLSLLLACAPHHIAERVITFLASVL